MDKKMQKEIARRLGEMSVHIFEMVESYGPEGPSGPQAAFLLGGMAQAVHRMHLDLTKDTDE
jgi:hypothetical protein